MSLSLFNGKAVSIDLKHIHTYRGEKVLDNDSDGVISFIKYKMYVFVDREYINSLSWCCHRLVLHSQSDKIDAQRTRYSYFH